MNTEELMADLTKAQQAAIEISGADVLVSAGAGSGKTRTLVARYMAALEAGVSPRKMAAITFTEKAAREMRNRIRRATQIKADNAHSEAERTHWRQLSIAMDGARIGTIHSLCAEIIRHHPAEIEIDPEFEVLEEGASRLLQREAVEFALAAAANDDDAVAIFRHYSAWGLQRLIEHLLENRLKVARQLNASETARPTFDAWMSARLDRFCQDPEVRQAVDQLEELSRQGYFEGTATDSMARMGEDLLQRWRRVQESLDRQDGLQAAGELFDMRRDALKGGIGKRDGPARLAVDRLQARYDQLLDPWLAGKKASDNPPDPEIEFEYESLVEIVEVIFQKARGHYLKALDQRAALDFDGLEAGARQLLDDHEVRRKWQSNLEKVLVDEFQDTNERQRQIVLALTADQPGKLFVVGDARQSIYRFRGAEVSIFRKLEDQLAEEGHSLYLDRTFRQHPELLGVYDDWLPPLMGAEADEDFMVPYRRLKSDREGPRKQTRPPYVEIIIGLGERAAEARPVAATLLADRLLGLWRNGEIQAWEEVALLFRASTGFSGYEDALSEAGIPYVTVAGRGFYERPEIREVLNALRALAEPWNETAMVGLLRSAAIGMSDIGIFRLRVGDQSIRPLEQALVDHSIKLDPEDEISRQRALAMLTDLTPLVDRLPVADLLKQWMDWVDARALLAIAGERHWANLDKLLVDARRSGTTRVRAFLEYLRLSQQAGVREGEAPAEVSGAVRLMTIHKAKGLEFPYVVLADAGYQHRSFRPVALVHPEVGLALQPDLWQASSVRYRVARSEELKMDEAEENRLLYVALTRAKEKVLISGHARSTNKTVRPAGWLRQLLEVAGVEAGSIPTGLSEFGSFNVFVDDKPAEFLPLSDPSPPLNRKAGRRKPLFPPLSFATQETTDDEYDESPARAWRASGRRRPPASVVGVLVHRALERWLFPADEALDHLLRVSAIGEGLIESDAQDAALKLAKELLARFQTHPLWQEINDSQERLHEVPYTYQPAQGPPDSGAIDLVYKGQGGWQLLDFKTDQLAEETELEAAVVVHSGQIRRYSKAARQLLGDLVQSRLVFLDAMGEVRLMEVQE